MGRKHLLAAAPIAAPRNITLPFSLEELGLQAMDNHASKGSSRRRLMAATTSGVCRARNNINFSGGGLNGGARIKDVQTAAGCCTKCLRTIGCEAWTWSSKTKICYPKGPVGWTATPLRGSVSGVVQRPAAAAVPPPPEISAPAEDNSADGELAWNPTLVLGDHALKKGFAKETSTAPKANNKYVVQDPTGDSTAPVVKAVYQKVGFNVSNI